MPEQIHTGSGDNVAGNKYVNVNLHGHKAPEALTHLPTIQVSGTNEESDIIGREKDLTALREKMRSSQKVALVQGMGGIGKTLLAQAYLTKHFEEYHHKAWITITGDIITSFTTNGDLCRNLDINTGEKTTARELFAIIMNALRSLENSTPSLLVIDNADSNILEKEVLSHLPSPPHWHILLTSREKLDYFNIFPLGFLSPAGAVQLFKKHCTVINRR